MDSSVGPNANSKLVQLLNAYVAIFMAFGFGVLVSSHFQWGGYGVTVGATIQLACSAYFMAFALYRSRRSVASKASGFALLALTLTTAGCPQPAGPKAGSPPIEFSFRKAQVPTRGMVVGIKNASSSETLESLTVEVRSPGEETTRSHVVEKEIKPRDSITVGWVELDGWKLKPGDEISVTADRYTEPKTVTVPKP